MSMGYVFLYSAIVAAPTFVGYPSFNVLHPVILFPFPVNGSESRGDFHPCHGMASGG